MADERTIEEVAAVAVDCAYHIHRRLGPGLLESVYETVLEASLRRAGLSVARQLPISFHFDGMAFSDAFRIDLLVDGRLIIEIKSVEAFSKVHAKQLLTYLRLAEQPLGLLLNFGAATFRDGVKRVVNKHIDLANSPLRVNRPLGADWDSFFDEPGSPDFPDANEKYDENGKWIPEGYG